MKFVKKYENETQLRNVKCGECFKYNGNIVMVIEGGDEFYVHCVNIETGELNSINAKILVTCVNIEAREV